MEIHVLQNQADSPVYRSERTLREQGDRVPSEVRSQIEGKLSALRSAMQSGGGEVMRRALEDLQEALQGIGSAVYGRAGETGAGAAAGSRPGAGGAATVEGEYREV